MKRSMPHYQFIYLTYLGIMLFFITVVPLICVFIFDNPQGNSSPEYKNKIDCPSYITVFRHDSNRSQKIAFEEYVKGVVACEMPSSFTEEALKAQAVAARTYALAKIKKNVQLCDSTHCQVYKSKKELVAIHPNGWEDNGYDKVCNAVDATKGEAMYYDGKLVMQPLFFSSSGGRTENSQDVFVGTYPYLVSVSSPYENGASHRNEEKDFAIKKFSRQIKKAYPDKDFGKIKKSNISIVSRTDGGRVEKIKIGKSTLKGTQLRDTLELSSTFFDISFDGKDIIFTSSGAGHGVGMSQYGANGMAKKGYNYKDILKHYYTGVDVY
ncbi:MAG: stage II sporulation protein D [Anaerovoracaceae bacterium]